MTATTAWAVLAAIFTSTALIIGRPPPRLLCRLRLAGPRTGGTSPRRRSALPGLRVLVALPLVGLVVLLLAAGLPLARMVLALTALTVVGYIARVAVRDRAQAVQRAAAVQSAEIVEVVAGSLRAGITADLALARAAAEFDVLEPVATAAMFGQDVPAALRAVADQPGRDLLADLAAGWSVALRTGAPLADVLARIGEAARSERDLRRQVQAAAAPARATGRVMALLPLLGLALGAVAGANPWHTVTSTPVAAVSVAAGVLLALVGAAWVDRLVTSAEAP